MYRTRCWQSCQRVRGDGVGKGRGQNMASCDMLTTRGAMRSLGSYFVTAVNAAMLGGIAYAGIPPSSSAGAGPGAASVSGRRRVRPGYRRPASADCGFATPPSDEHLRRRYLHRGDSRRDERRPRRPSALIPHLDAGRPVGLRYLRGRSGLAGRNLVAEKQRDDSIVNKIDYARRPDDRHRAALMQR